MSVRSWNTAVTWENPLRVNERVDSSPEMPASAVSTTNVTCRSISNGDREASTVLIWTCTLVMSGTASIGRRVRQYAPKVARMSTARTTVPRRSMEKVRIRASMARSSVLVLVVAALPELGFHQVRAGGGDALAGGQAGGNLRDRQPDPTERDGLRSEDVAVDDVHDGLLAAALQRSGRHRDGDL